MNAAGPWVGDVISAGFGRTGRHAVRLVRGSHIVTRRLFEHDRAYILQQPDRRVVFAIPYETDFTLIGTTDVEHEGPPGEATCTPAERDYLLAAVGAYFSAPPTVADIVWSENATGVPRPARGRPGLDPGAVRHPPRRRLAPPPPRPAVRWAVGDVPSPAVRIGSFHDRNRDVRHHVHA